MLVVRPTSAVRGVGVRDPDNHRDSLRLRHQSAFRLHRRAVHQSLA
jgi:hypothetical protein